MSETPGENTKPGGLTFEVSKIEIGLTVCFYFYEGGLGGRQDDGEAEYRRRSRRVAQCDGEGYREEAGGE